MNIDDIEIKIKKYDRNKNIVIVNVIVQEVWEIRGYTLRYTTTKYSNGNPVWVITPPCIKSRGGKYFHIVRCLDSALWQKIQERVIILANEHVSPL